MLTNSLVSNDVLASPVITWMDEGVSPANSCRVLRGDDGDLYWVTRDDGEQIRYDKDPLGTFGRRFAMGFIGMLPVENQSQADWSTATRNRSGPDARKLRAAGCLDEQPLCF